MRVFRPLVTRPSQHLLLVTFRKAAARVEAALIGWLILSWCWPAIAYNEFKAVPLWFWLIWVAIPVVLIAVLRRYFLDLARRCLGGDAFAFDTASGTLTHAGRTVPLRDIRKIILRTFTGSKNQTFSVVLLLEDESRIDVAILDEEPPVTELADQLSTFLGLKTDIEYADAWEREGIKIKSLDLTQHRLDADDKDSGAATRQRR